MLLYFGAVKTRKKEDNMVKNKKKEIKKEVLINSTDLKTLQANSADKPKNKKKRSDK